MRVYTRLRAGIPIFALLAASAALAQPAATARLTGTATIGAVSRQVAIQFSCAVERKKINNLAVSISIPDAAKFKSIFDVDPFEGPGALSAKMHLAAADGAVHFDSGSTGSFGSEGDPGTSFTFEDAETPGSGAALRKLQAFVTILAGGAARLTWRIENPVKGQPGIEAVVNLTTADASRVRAATAECRAR